MRENSLFQSNAPKYYNPLKGLLFCPCGCGLYMKPNHNSYLIYRCSSAYNDKQKAKITASNALISYRPFGLV